MVVTSTTLSPTPPPPSSSVHSSPPLRIFYRRIISVTSTRSAPFFDRLIYAHTLDAVAVWFPRLHSPGLHGAASFHRKRGERPCTSDVHRETVSDGVAQIDDATPLFESATQDTAVWSFTLSL